MVKSRVRQRGKSRKSNALTARQKTASYLRNFTFGVEDSLVSTVGLLSGIAAANVPQQTIFLTGLVLIFVEAFSMAVGSFLSEHSAEDYLERKESRTQEPGKNGAIMFFSYFVVGFIPLLPYVLLDIPYALPVSISLSLISLFILGAINAAVSRTHALKEGLEMSIIGGLAIALGIMVGKMVMIA